jgi:protein O-GlcNAc transferase
LLTGLPVLTLIGEPFAGRVAASLLNAIHLPELITTKSEVLRGDGDYLATHLKKIVRKKEGLS